MKCCDATDCTTDDDSTISWKFSLLKTCMGENKLTPQLCKNTGKTDVSRNHAKTDSNACGSTLKKIKNKMSVWKTH